MSEHLLDDDDSFRTYSEEEERKIRRLQFDLDDIKKHFNFARGVIFGYAGLQLIVVLYNYAQGGIFARDILLIDGSFVVLYAIAGFISIKYPLPGFITALVIFTLILFLILYLDPRQAFYGFLWKGIFLFGVIRGISSALKKQKIEKQLARLGASGRGMV